MGLMYVQSIYIKRGLVIQSQIFNQYINEALVRVAIKTEEQQAYQTINRPNLETVYQQVQSMNGNCGLSLQYLNGQIVLDVDKAGELYTFSGSSFSEIDSLVKMANLGPDIESELNGGLLNGYNDLIEDMTMRFLYGAGAKLSFDSAQIFNYLQFELDRMEINTPFEFALLDGYSLRPWFSSFDKIPLSAKHQAYSTTIHPSPFTGEHAILLVDFPKKRSFLLQSNSKLLSFSFLFIFLIAASFGASIYIILKQKKLSALKTDFINNMTHELKTPVATISLANQMLNKERVREDAAKVENYNNIIGVENKRLGTHIERVLQIAQLEKEDLKLSKEVVDVHIVLRDLLTEFQLRFDDADASVSTSFEAASADIRADQGHISSVFSNILDNAIKYKRDVPLQITIRTYHEKDTLCVEITDNGMGMSNSDQKKVFTKFYRVSTGNIHNVKGFGLGLSYVKTIIEAHQGEIRVKSELNKYTTFLVKLPLTKKSIYERA